MEGFQSIVFFVMFISIEESYSRQFKKEGDFGFRTRKGSDFSVRSQIQCAVMCNMRLCSNFYFREVGNLCNLQTNYAVSPISDPQDDWSYYAATNIGTNIALNKAAAQSSTYLGEIQYRGAHFAVDGKVANILGGLNCTHTNMELQPWLNIELGNIYQIDRVVVFNRQDATPEKGERLQYFRVDVIQNTDIKLCGFFNYVSKSAETIIIMCHDKPEGSEIRIMLTLEGILSLAEVEVYDWA